MKNKLYFLIMFALALAVPLLQAGAESDHYRIPLQISAPEHDRTPLFVGIPFPKGMVTAPDELTIVDEAGGTVPTSARVMARWPGHDSIRWMGVQFVGSPAGRYFAVPASGRPIAAASGIRVVEDRDGFLVNTGLAQYRLNRQGALIAEAWLDHNGDGRFQPEEKIIDNTLGDDLYAVDHRGREGWAGRDTAPDQLRYETAHDERSPEAPLLSAEFRREGWYLTGGGDRLARHVTRLSFYAGDANVHVEHRLILTESTHRLWLSDYGLRFRYGARASEVMFPKGTDPASGTLRQAISGESVHLFQEKAFYLSRMNREEDCRFEIARTDAEGVPTILHSGPLAGNWALTQTGHGAVGVALKNLWQLYPKELQATPDALVVRLWSPRGGRTMDFRYTSLRALWPEGWYESAPAALKKRLPQIDTDAAGMARTHDLVLSLQSQADLPAMQKTAARLQHPALCIVAPEWLRTSEAMGRFHPYDADRYPREESFMEAWFDQAMKIVRDWGDYGFLDFGNWPHVWYQQEEGTERWAPSIDRYAACLDYGFNANLWRMYARSGQRKYFEAAEETTTQRMDISMAHWDGLSPDASLSERLPRRLRGTYTFSNSPFPWSGGASFHHNSGTDIRTLAYWHYLTGRRSAGEMLRDYGAAVKRVWNSGNLAPFRATRPFPSLRNLATVYQETGDPDLLDITLKQLRWLADPEAPQGVAEDKETTGLGKYGVKVGAIHRVYEVTEDPLAKAALLRGAFTRATTSLGDPPFTYHNTSAEQLSEAARITADPVLVRALRRDIALAISSYYDESARQWKPLYPARVFSLAANVYPLGGMAYSLDLLSDPDFQKAAEAPLTPYARTAGTGPEVYAMLKKSAGGSVRIDLRSYHSLDPKVYGPDGALVTNVRMEPSRDQLFSRQQAATRWRLELPEELPGGVYRIESGAGFLPWEITWSDAPKLALFAPDGLMIGCGDRHWGNRLVSAREDHAEPVFFEVPPGTGEFGIYANSPVQLTSPTGETLSVGANGREWQSITATEGIWRIDSQDPALVMLRGVPPVFAYALAERLFQPGIPALPAPLAGPERGLMLEGKARLRLDAASLLSPEAGTLECWVRPNWSSIYQWQENQKVRTLIDGQGWKLQLHRFGEMSVTAILETREKTGPRQIESNAPAVLREGKWTHLALQWRKEGDDFVLELFVNGRPQRFGMDNAGMAERITHFSPVAFGDLFIGAARNGAQPLEGEIAGLRLSSAARYSADFIPDRNDSMKVDGDTIALYPLAGELTSASGTAAPQLHPLR